jgi:hypothetical protein
VGRECQIKPVHGLGNLTSLRAHSTDYQTKLVLLGRAPFPIPNLRQVLAVFVDVSTPVFVVVVCKSRQ